METIKRNLKRIKRKATVAIDVVASMVDALTSLNEEIDNEIAEIVKTQEELRNIQGDLFETKVHNDKIVNNLKQLIGE